MIDAWLREIVLVHLAATWFMVGLIWFVQIVHYPLMSCVGTEAWDNYERQHQRRTTRVVAPVMLIELATALLLLAAAVTGSHELLASTWSQITVWLSAALLGVAWLSTFAVQVRLHAKLSRSNDDVLLQRLVRSNWIRTIAWSARGVLLLSLLH